LLYLDFLSSLNPFQSLDAVIMTNTL
jgi:hypothetical protein